MARRGHWDPTQTSLLLLPSALAGLPGTETPIVSFKLPGMGSTHSTLPRVEEGGSPQFLHLLESLHQRPQCGI